MKKNIPVSVENINSFERQCEEIFGNIEINDKIPKSNSIEKELMGQRRVSLLSLIERHSEILVDIQKQIEQLNKPQRNQKCCCIIL